MSVALPSGESAVAGERDDVCRSDAVTQRISIPSRRRLARSRVPLAQAALANCHLCAHHCGVNRLADERGLCQAASVARVFSAQVEVADELELIPTFAIALSGCDLRCDFCITGAQSWNPRAGGSIAPDEIARRAEAALADGARTVMILGGEPTIHLSAALEIIASLPEEATLVWKTNAHASVEALALLEGLVDVWLPDYKFGNDNCAQRLARVPDYTRIVRENLRRMRGQRAGRAPRVQVTSLSAGHGSREGWRQPGRLSHVAGDDSRHWLDRPATLNKSPSHRKPATLIVRHLLMPGHVECCWRSIAEWLAEGLSGVRVSLRDGFWPGWRSGRHGELSGTLRGSEVRSARDIAAGCGLDLVQ
jgi:putative pyruvate formate lyase activating enzyme